MSRTFIPEFFWDFPKRSDTGESLESELIQNNSHHDVKGPVGPSQCPKVQNWILT